MKTLLFFSILAIFGLSQNSLDFSNEKSPIQEVAPLELPISSPTPTPAPNPAPTSISPTLPAQSTSPLPIEVEKTDIKNKTLSIDPRFGIALSYYNANESDALDILRQLANNQFIKTQEFDLFGCVAAGPLIVVKNISPNPNKGDSIVEFNPFPLIIKSIKINMISEKNKFISIADNEIPVGSILTMEYQNYTCKIKLAEVRGEEAVFQDVKTLELGSVFLGLNDNILEKDEKETLIETPTSVKFTPNQN